MDGQRFDAIARALAIGATRRRLIGLAAGLFGSGLVRPPVRAVGGCAESCDDANPCNPITGCGACCDGFCVNTTNDLFNCGGCGVICAQSEGCFGGTCKQLCDAGLTRCDDLCVDLQIDAGHCGTCSTVCSGGDDCISGVCGGACPAGTFLCGSECVDGRSDPANCGDCGIVCGSGQLCINGGCDLTCGDGLNLCSSGCADLTSDSANCGGCDIVCATGQVCNGGGCSGGCPSGFTVCGGSCVDTSSDAANCGGCDVLCGENDRCGGGICAGSSSCPDGETLCGELCVDIVEDPDNCGDCDVMCGDEELCVDGSCAVATPVPGQTLGARRPDPARCTAEPRSGASLLAACNARGGEPSPVAAANWDEVVAGQPFDGTPVSGAVVQRIQTTLFHLIACMNAGDVPRQTALMTDPLAGAMLSAYGLCGEVPELGAVALPDRRWLGFTAIRSAFVTGGDQVDAFVTITEPDPRLTRVGLARFRREGGAWRLDRFDPIDPPAGSGSLTVRYFDCSGAPLRDARCQPSLVTHGMTVIPDDTSEPIGFAEAVVTGRGIARWSSLPIGSVRLAVDIDVTQPIAVEGAVPLSDSTRHVYQVAITATNPNAVVDLFLNGTDSPTLQIGGTASPCGPDACPPCNVCDSPTGLCVLACAPGESCDDATETCSCIDYAASVCLRDRFACRGDAGDSCSGDDQCCDGACIDGACACLTEGDPCTDDAGCCEGLSCDYGTCAGCTTAIGQSCDAEASCCDGLCVDGLCQCCQTCATADGAFTSAIAGLCCPLGALCYPETSQGPGFARCCTPGVDCLDDPAGPPSVAGANAIYRNTCFSNPT